MTDKEEIIINARLKGDSLKTFELILEEWGHENHSEAIRFIIKQYWKFFKEEREFIKNLEKYLQELSRSNNKMLDLIEKSEKKD